MYKLWAQSGIYFALNEHPDAKITKTVACDDKINQEEAKKTAPMKRDLDPESIVYGV